MIEDRLECKQRRILVAIATAVVYADVAPAQGQAWIIRHAYGWHDDDAGPLQCLWALDMGAGFRDLCNAAGLALNVFNHLYTSVPCQGPLVLRFGQTLRFNAAAKANGHNVVIEMVIDEIVGEETYSG